MKLVFSIFLAACSVVSSQNSFSYWQQHVDYNMSVDMNVANWQYTGTQKLVYTNHSPDTLNQVFYHMYFNAFQPGSEMDVRSRTIADPDRRVGDRIAGLSPSEQGFLKATALTQDGVALEYSAEETILVVPLKKPLAPHESTVLTMEFHGQVPVQIRRSGRNNAEGVALSMTQWYPKLAEYDKDGWHTDPYIAREFYGVWGDFEIALNIDSSYVVGGTGYLKEKSALKKGRTRWVFQAPMVHDFTWAADPDYIHDTYPGPDGVTLNFYYKNDPALKENWKALQPVTAELLDYFNKAIGPYPYKQYSVIQGGDGGMEYAMCTLITGDRSFESLVGVTAHEMAHTWFQFLLATNEALHEWMDEGFTSYISSLAEHQVLKQDGDPVAGSYRGYNFLANSGAEQPLSTHADRYNTNRNYGIAAYSKGAVFLAQLGYVVGEEVLAQIIKEYFNTWAFKHPEPRDFIRVAERVSGLNLDWYLQDFATTTNTIDYGIVSVGTSASAEENSGDGAQKNSGKTAGSSIQNNAGTTAMDNKSSGQTITLERLGLMPMPIDLQVNFADGSSRLYYIPLQMMRGEKSFGDRPVTVLRDWAWARPTYSFDVETSSEIVEVIIDPSGRMADVQKENNRFVRAAAVKSEN
jgi:hypothetical protein